MTLTKTAALLSATAILAAGAAGAQGIKVGQITTISGGFPFGDVVRGTESYFNMVNDAGGVHGLTIEFMAGDDKGQASEAAQLARKFVLQDQVVAMVGNTSLTDCPANNAFYAAQNVGVIGGGTQTSCFSHPNWTPINTGPYIGHLGNWEYLFNVLQPESVCAIEQNDPTSIEAYDQMYEWIQEVNPNATGKFAMITYTNDASQNPVPAVTAAKQAGCDAVTLSTVAPNAIAFVNPAKAVGLDATFMCLGSCYDASLPEALGELGEPGGLGPRSKGFFVGAELADIDADVPQVQEMVTQLEKDGVPANFWSEIGWVSAALFVDALRQAPEGADLTSAAGVLDALRNMEPYDSGFAATPLIFGPGETHSPNRGVQMLTLSGGDWVIAEGQNGGEYTVINEMPDFLK